MKVYIVMQWDGSKWQKVVGIFSEEGDAKDYCDRVDPSEKSLTIDDYTVDKLLECTMNLNCQCEDCRKKHKENAYWPADRGL